ncbi:MAG: lycopene cyclase domain-containing protein [Microbacteriaceae bacterium]
MPGVYLGLIVLSLIGMALIDYHWKVALFEDVRHTVLVLVLSVAFFVSWDISGVANGVFYKGASNLLIGWDVATEIPIEEILFLTLLSYCAVIAFRLVERGR